MEPVIGIPFYLADPKLQRLESEMNDIEDTRQIMMYMRHEAGHAFNYAYALYKTGAWRDLFRTASGGLIEKATSRFRFHASSCATWRAGTRRSIPTKTSLKPLPCWLTPRSNWRKRYKGWGAMKKLLYMDRIGRTLGDADPVVAHGDTDITVDEMAVTVGEFYERALEQQLTPDDLPLDTDLRDIFKVSKRRRKNVRPAVELLRENRKILVDKVNYWTGVQRPLVKKLVETIEAKVSDLGLSADIKNHERESLTEVICVRNRVGDGTVSIEANLFRPDCCFTFAIGSRGQTEKAQGHYGKS